jgi:hypothetical protein
MAQSNNAAHAPVNEPFMVCPVLLPEDTLFGKVVSQPDRFSRAKRLAWSVCPGPTARAELD